MPFLNNHLTYVAAEDGSSTPPPPISGKQGFSMMYFIKFRDFKQSLPRYPKLRLIDGFLMA
jgi:hypothetical protein